VNVNTCGWRGINFTAMYLTEITAVSDVAEVLDTLSVKLDMNLRAISLSCPWIHGISLHLSSEFTHKKLAIWHSAKSYSVKARGVAGFLWLGGPDNRGAVGAENSTAEGTLGTSPQIFSSNLYKSQGFT
jgi:hypothetical protein